MSGTISNWKGFTAEDIKNCSNETATNKKRSPKEPRKSHPNKPSEMKYKSSKTPDAKYPVPVGAKLCPSNESTDTSTSVSSSSDSSPSHALSGPHPKNITILVADEKSYEVLDPPDISASDNPENSQDSNDHTCLLVEKKSLEKFQERQKLMEQQNKKRKELLTKALSDRKKQTISETKKLQQIQEELTHLDSLLSNDVGTLRNQIEQASLEFNEAQKQYDQAESAFVTAKLNLFDKMEQKQLLTEHLCKIIEANELRKARKLSDLMTRLEIASEENANQLVTYPENNIFLERPCSLDEVAYAVCTTLKSPNKSKDMSSETTTATEKPTETKNAEIPPANASSQPKTTEIVANVSENKKAEISTVVTSSQNTKNDSADNV